MGFGLLGSCHIIPHLSIPFHLSSFQFIEAKIILPAFKQSDKLAKWHVYFGRNHILVILFFNSPCLVLISFSNLTTASRSNAPLSKTLTDKARHKFTFAPILARCDKA